MPNFLIVGAQKSATSSLYEYLRAHPQVFLPDDKEPAYFVEQLAWGKGLAWYESLFDKAGDAVAVGEATTSYTMFPAFGGVPARIGALLPTVRIIYIMRNPVERMRSAYIQGLASGAEHRPIADALLYDSRYLNASRYALQLEQYLRHFPETQILLLTAEGLRDQRAETMRKVLGFLGVDPGYELGDLSVEYHRSEGKRAPRLGWRLLGDLVIRSGLTWLVPDRLERLNGHWPVSRAIYPTEVMLSDDLRERLRDTLRPDVESIRARMGAGFDGWGLLE